MKRISAIYRPDHSLASSYIKQAWYLQHAAKSERLDLIKKTRLKLAKHILARRKKAWQAATKLGWQAGYLEINTQFKTFQNNQAKLFKQLEQSIINQVITLTKTIILDELKTNPMIITKRVQAAMQKLGAKNVLELRLPCDTAPAVLQSLPKNICLDATLATGNFKLILANGSAEANWEEQLEFLENK